MTSKPIPLRLPLKMGEEVSIPVAMAELLVFSNCLVRLEEKLDEIGLFDEAERTALWGLENMLEKLNPVIFSDQYDFYIRQAKAFLIGSEEDV